jgi:Ca-activated chloride channel homolog
MTTMRRPTATLGVLALCAAALAPPPLHAAEVKLDAELDRSVLHSQTSGKVYLRLSLKSLAGKKALQRSPVNVALVIDRSGSMQGERIAAAKKGAKVALDRLDKDDVVSLVAYNHNVKVLSEASPLGNSRDRLVRAIEGLESGGTTALYAGVREGGSQVEDFLSDTKVNRVVLLSDGLANVGPSSPSELAKLGRKLASKGITVSTIGLGLQYNEDLMQHLAAASDGNHAFVERPSDLAEIFDREFGDALTIAAQDLTITIECRVGFKPVRVLGRDADISGNRVTLKLNQLQAENERYVIVELDAPEGQTPGEVDVAQIDVAFRDIESGKRNRSETKARVRISKDRKEAEGSVNKSVTSQVTEQVATENSEKAVELRDKGDIAGARTVLEKNAAYLNEQSTHLSAGAAAAPADSIANLKKLEEESLEAAKGLEGKSWNKTRKMMRSDQHRSKVQQAY